MQQLEVGIAPRRDGVCAGVTCLSRYASTVGREKIFSPLIFESSVMMSSGDSSSGRRTSSPGRCGTHPRVFDPPTPLDRALEDLESLLESPRLVLLGEGPSHATFMRQMAVAGRTRGNLVHDAHIAALALEHGVREIWTADRDFSRFAPLRARNPLE